MPAPLRYMSIIKKKKKKNGKWHNAFFLSYEDALPAALGKSVLPCCLSLPMIYEYVADKILKILSSLTMDTAKQAQSQPRALWVDGSQKEKQNTPGGLRPVVSD